jgi:hypothetical protein
MKKIFIAGAFILFATMVQAQNVGIGTTTPVAKLNIVGNYSNPTIPGVTSTGVFRIGVSAGEGIDFGKLNTTPYSAWMQAGFGGVIPDPISLQPLGGNVGIGTISPQFSAVLEISSTTKGFLPPRMTSPQRDAIASPVEGLTIYNTTINAFEAYNGTAWYSTVHFIGENYGGGIVFYIYDNGQHGLIASNNDQNGGADIRWHGGTNTVTRARADGVGAGLKNTAIIIANQGPVDGNPFAATVCNEYSVAVAGVTYGDWYLPSKHELNLLYLQKTLVGGFASGIYWSSSESGSSDVWYRSFVNGGQSTSVKSTTYHVRAVRAF